MNFTDSYTTTLWGIFLINLTWLVQWFVATGARSSVPHLVPGKFDDSLSHNSFAFRAHRTFMNSVENVPALLSVAFLAVISGTNPLWTGIFVWIYALARIAHTVLYYAIRTEKNPSPRSYFFLIGLAANVGLLLLVPAALL